MSLQARLKSIFRNLFRKPQTETRLDDELRCYIDLVTDEKMCRGHVRGRSPPHGSH